MDCFEAAAGGAFMCFQSAEVKLINVKRLWPYSYGKGAIYMHRFLLTFGRLLTATTNPRRVWYSRHGASITNIVCLFHVKLARI